MSNNLRSKKEKSVFKMFLMTGVLRMTFGLKLTTAMGTSILEAGIYLAMVTAAVSVLLLIMRKDAASITEEGEDK